MAAIFIKHPRENIIYLLYIVLYMFTLPIGCNPLSFDYVKINRYSIMLKLNSL